MPKFEFVYPFCGKAPTSIAWVSTFWFGKVFKEGRSESAVILETNNTFARQRTTVGQIRLVLSTIFFIKTEVFTGENF